MQRRWACYTTHCCNCGRKGLLQLWSDKGSWGYSTGATIAAAVNGVHPEMSVIRCAECLSPVVAVERQSDVAGCTAANCRLIAAKHLRSGADDASCPLARDIPRQRSAGI